MNFTTVLFIHQIIWKLVQQKNGLFNANSIKYLILRTLHPWRVNEAVTYYEQQLKPIDEKVSNLKSNEYAAEEEFNDQEAPDEYESAWAMF